MAAARPLVPVWAAQGLPALASFPHYDRSRRACSIAHLGVGNFHRAHQARFLDEYLQTHDEDWLMHGIGLLETDRGLLQAMNVQDGLYTLTERSGSRDTTRVIGSIKTCSHAPADPQGVAALLASSNIRIITLTITEKGYGYDAAGNLDLDHPAIRADLAPGATPQTALGYLFAAAARRMATHAPPVTIVSCDNLPGNGNMLARLLAQFAERKDAAVGRWIRANISFPNCMVDRITPATTAATLEYVRETFGIDDRCPVVSESYLQWIVEDRFVAGRPQLESVGVQFVDDVAPYEQLKVWLLNGSHSALAYPAYLLGYRAVDAAMRDPLLRTYVRRYMDEDITPALPAVPGIDVTAYKATLLERFSNPAISDQVQRLAMDGSQKIRNAIVPPLEHQIGAGGSIKWIAFALAAWYRYLRGVDEGSAAIEIVDPRREALTARATAGPDDPAPLLSMPEIFGLRIPGSSRVLAAVQDCVAAIDRLGTRRALAELLAQ